MELAHCKEGRELSIQVHCDQTAERVRVRERETVKQTSPVDRGICQTRKSHLNHIEKFELYRIQ